MRIFLCGGGCGQQTVDANKKLNEVIDHNKPILYIPLAMPSERYPSCYEWIKDELKGIDVPNIDMVVSGTDLFNKNLENYSALFIGGGNTFKLLKDLKDSGSFEKIKVFIENNGIVFGGSAGAIILGQCIDTCKYADKNEVDLKDLMGFDVVSHFSFLCHFTNQTSVYKGYKQDKIEMRGDRAEMSDFPLYLNTVAGGLDRRDQTIGGFSFVVKIYAVPVVEIIGQLLYLLGRYGFNAQFGDCL